MVYENSRYLHTSIASRDSSGVYFFRTRERFKFPTRNMTFHEWKEGDSLYTLAVKYYEIASLRWAILDANPQYRTEFEIKAGDSIAIPSLTDVLNVVSV